MTKTAFGLALGIDGVGWHPAAERTDAASRPADPKFWSRIIGQAENAGFDLATFEDQLELPAGSGHSARFDSFSLASWLAPQTSRIGLVPAATTATQEPFHIATATQTLDFTSSGRAGLRLRIGLYPEELRAAGRKPLFKSTEEFLQLEPAEQQRNYYEGFEEGWEFAQIVRLLWDSWQDDAEIRDVATGRFLDAERIHNPDFQGDYFSVFGASITPRSPQGQPPVFALAHQEVPYEFASAAADVAFITPFDEADLIRRREGAEAAAKRVGREGTPLQIWPDIAVSVGEEGQNRLDELNEVLGEEFVTDTGIFAGTAGELVELIVSWHEQGLHGARLRPLSTSADLAVLADEVLPKLHSAGIAPADATAATLRARLGLPIAENRFVGTAPFTADFHAAKETLA
ncbi:LLM class flavin-dependent oxidoreductase [Gulosibacter chungangensis]|uniref:LLM class flavin-dependent oxidoreductase n=1 Tax=Gulosibacter chungangensis TaxID=979746 RepID=A0A7J5BCT3_9MICO|nr:LLM class flavin-dependent oxidoreductase [Gulosibacter chungangensis]KAB1644000.1 LLM class flavin-dependent oxidoreductase [Gulosibacter chungangensis]